MRSRPVPWPRILLRGGDLFLPCVRVLSVGRAFKRPRSGVSHRLSASCRLYDLKRCRCAVSVRHLPLYFDCIFVGANRWKIPKICDFSGFLGVSRSRDGLSLSTEAKHESFEFTSIFLPVEDPRSTMSGSSST